MSYHRLSVWSVPTIVLLSLSLMLLFPTTAAAHERRAIAGGKAEAVVGWLVEPTFVEQPNGVSFAVTNATTKQPIEGLDKTVKVEVSHGGTARQYDLRARFGQPGAYTADLIPTRAGDYTFRFTGEIEGVTIDERFESGPGRFNAVEAPSSRQFPATQPTVGELQRELADARAAADTARTLGLVGTALGLAGLLLAGLLALRGRPAAPAVTRPAAGPQV